MSTTETVPKKLFTRDEFQRILDAGIFPTNKRYELIRGEIIEMPRIAGAHAGRVNFLTRLFTSRLGESVIVSIQNPMAIDDYSEPKPDVTILTPLQEFFDLSIPEPQDVLLLVEVSYTTIRYDTKIKKPLYAEAGVAEYWVLDIKGDAVIVLTEPSEGEYRRQETYRRGQTITAKALPAFTFSIDEILGPVHESAKTI